MIDLDLGRALKRALGAHGVSWEPRPGDHFVVPDRGLDDTVFVVSHMVVEVLDTPHGPYLAFNGTTEWALDSIEVPEVVWLPLEHQLRELLGDDFVSCERQASPADLGEPAPAGYVVTVRSAPGHDGSRRYADTTPAGAYARAVLDRFSRRP